MSIINRGDQIDKAVYENTPCNYVAIVGMLFLFWTIQMLHWFAVYSLGIHFSEFLTIYSAIMFAVAIIIIGCMLILGSVVNKKKATSEYYKIKISEARIQMKQAD
jgi:amino acid permease